MGPLFIREPKLGFAQDVAGHSLFTGDPYTYVTKLIAAVDEALLVEEVLFCVAPAAANITCDDGALILYLRDEVAADAFRCPLQTYPLKFVDPGLREGSARIKIGFTLPPGYGLYFAHSVQRNGAGGYLLGNVTAFGGILR